MQEIIKSNYKFIREVWTRKDAINFFQGQGENYKVEIISNIPEGEKLTIKRWMRFVFFIAINVKIVVFRDVPPFNLVHMCKGFV